ncbi:hypothetical protein C0J52_12498 [Blattella germanica]|nr:hypothetical protein C0J52_12498 [Blattella germanica]
MVVSQSCTMMCLAWETIGESRREWREESKLWIQKMWHFPPKQRRSVESAMQSYSRKTKRNDPAEPE